MAKPTDSTKRPADAPAAPPAFAVVAPGGAETQAGGTHVDSKHADGKHADGKHADGKHADKHGKPSDKREAILSAALELFVERGFYGTAVPEIAERAGVGAGTIYRYFDSKEALVNTIYREEKTRFGRLAMVDFPATAPTREQFRTMWMRMAEFATANPKAFVFMELHHHAPYLDAQNVALEAQMLVMFTNVVVAAQARGDLKQGPPSLLMGIVMGAFVGVIRSCVEIGASPEQANWKLAEQIMWEAIRA